MTNTTKAYAAIDTMEAMNRIGEQIQEKVEQIHEKRMTLRARLRAAVRSLLTCDTASPYGLTPEMEARLYL